MLIRKEFKSVSEAREFLRTLDIVDDGITHVIIHDTKCDKCKMELEKQIITRVCEPCLDKMPNLFFIKGEKVCPHCKGKTEVVAYNYKCKKCNLVYDMYGTSWL